MNSCDIGGFVDTPLNSSSISRLLFFECFIKFDIHEYEDLIICISHHKIKNEFGRSLVF